MPFSAALLAIALARTPAVSPDAAYTFSLRPGPAIVVTLTITADPDGLTELAVDPAWGGVDNDGSDVGDLRVTDGKGASLDVSHPRATAWEVAAEPGETLTASYTIRIPGGRKEKPGNDYRTRLRDGFFQMHGELGLLFPAHLTGNAPRDFTVRWEGFERAGWAAASSFGPGETPPPIRRDADSFRHSLFIAGAPSALRVLVRESRGTRIGIAIARSDIAPWGFTDEAFADLCERIISAQRDFFSDWSDPWFLVTLTPEGEPGKGYSIGGTGVTNCFAMYCTPGLDLDPSGHSGRTIIRTLSHEYFHTWNGGKAATSAPGGGAYWLSEGFTNYFARRMLRRAGLWTDADVLRDINEAVAEYEANPERNAPNSRIAAEFWKDRDVGNLPYQRGDMIALALDAHLRSRGGSLDEVFIDFVRTAVNGGSAGDDAFLGLTAPRCEPAFVAALRESVLSGADVPLPPTIADPAGTLCAVERRDTDVGFDFEATKRDRAIRGVKPGSEAEKAGLRDGLTLKGASINSGPSPSAEVKVLDEHGVLQTIRYAPLSAPKPGRAYK